MDKEFVPYTESMNLKELGFDEPCLKYQWNDKEQSEWMARSSSPDVLHAQKYFQEEENIYTISIPTFSQAFRWFREKHRLHNGIIPFYDYYYYLIKDFVYDKEYQNEYDECSYEQAELACLRKLIEIAKSHQNT